MENSTANVIGAWLQREKAEKIERFRHLNPYVRKGQILFAGSSLMEQFPIYEFILDYELPFTIYNRGIGGFTTSELLHSMDECIFDLAPTVLFLNIGTNDLNEPDYDEKGMLARYEQILQRIIERLPQIKMFLLAYYPVNPKISDNPYLQETFRYRTNERILKANKGVRELAERYGAQYLDLNAGLTDAEGNLKAEYTIEGMHMYANGYKAVLDVLLPTLFEV